MSDSLAIQAVLQAMLEVPELITVIHDKVKTPGELARDAVLRAQALPTFECRLQGASNERSEIAGR